MVGSATVPVERSAEPAAKTQLPWPGTQTPTTAPGTAYSATVASSVVANAVRTSSSNSPVGASGMMRAPPGGGDVSGSGVAVHPDRKDMVAARATSAAAARRVCDPGIGTLMR